MSLLLSDSVTPLILSLPIYLLCEIFCKLRLSGIHSLLPEYFSFWTAIFNKNLVEGRLQWNSPFCEDFWGFQFISSEFYYSVKKTFIQKVSEKVFYTLYSVTLYIHDLRKSDSGKAICQGFGGNLPPILPQKLHKTPIYVDAKSSIRNTISQLLPASWAFHIKQRASNWGFQEAIRILQPVIV